MNLAILVLAAGKGTRMESALPKVLHPLRSKPLLEWVMQAATALRPDRLICIVGHEAQMVQDQLSPKFPAAEWVLQKETKGTGHAVMQAHYALEGFTGDIIVTCGDAPLLTSQTMALLVEKRRSTGAAASLLIGDILSPGSYGRVICEKDGTVHSIVEARDASPEVRALHTVNAGTYCFSSQDLWEQLAKINSDNQAGELYLTDVIGLLTEAGRSVTGIFIGDREMTVVNTRADLAALEAELVAEEDQPSGGAGTGAKP